MNKKVLLVDDDQNLLNGLRRHFRKNYKLLIAVGGREAVDLLKEHKDIAVIVSDMRMPEMTGLETLKVFHRYSPDTVRIMLTGNADQQTATDAVNEGAIYRFFNKPCSPETLGAGIDDALNHHRLLTAEKELLEQTLAGTVKFLVDLLAFSKPTSFARSTRIREWIKIIVPGLELKTGWKLDFAAMMLPLCDLIVPQEIWDKRDNNAPLTAEEKKTLEDAPQTIRSMVSQIPRLGDVADIVADTKLSTSVDARALSTEAKILIILEAIALTTNQLFPTAKTFKNVLPRLNDYDDQLFNSIQNLLLQDTGVDAEQFETVDIPVGALKAGYTLIDNLATQSGRLLLSSGTVLSKAHAEKLYALMQTSTFVSPIKVMRAKQ